MARLQRKVGAADRTKIDQYLDAAKNPPSGALVHYFLGGNGGYLDARMTGREYGAVLKAIRG